MLTDGVILADRYEIVGKIGTGGMSDVYKAKDHTLGRFVAIKVLKQEFSEDVNFVTKFRTEAQSAAGLEHPNIVNIYDVGSENGIHYIVMECVEGITLKTYIEKKGQLSYKEAISIAIQVGRGIEAAHNKRIIHRDIKPQNIIISTDGKVKVTDFGIARVANNQTIQSDAMGSVHYSSPEQARNGFVDGKSDIYSLGIVMYEMVTGRVPFDGDTTVSVAIQHLQEEMVEPSAYATTLPISVEKIILKSTQKSQDRRYDNISDLLVDLKKALISPDEDFVTMIPLGHDKTKVIQPEEVEEIKNKTNGIYPDEEEEESDEDEDEDEEDEDEGSGILNPKMEKAVTIMGIVAAVIIVIIIIYILGSVFGLFKFGGGKDKDNNEANIVEEEEVKEEDASYKMIDLTGKTVQEAIDGLKKYGIGVQETGSEASDQYEAGQIIGQNIKAGETVKKNDTVNVTVSSGVGDVEVPSLTGYSQDAAKSMLDDLGLVGVRDWEFSNEKEGDVIKQEPAPGTKVKKGSTVTYIVSRGKEAVRMTSVLNLSEEAAKAEIERLGLNTGTVTTANDDTVPEGSVISQSIPEGKYVDPGTSVDLTISLGRKVVYYSYTDTIQALGNDPNKTYEATVTLHKKDSGETILINGSESLELKSFPATITATDIADSSEGILTIDWKIITTDEEGNQTVDSKPVTQTKTFKKNN